MITGCYLKPKIEKLFESLQFFEILEYITNCISLISERTVWQLFIS